MVTACVGFSGKVGGWTKASTSAGSVGALGWVEDFAADHRLGGGDLGALWRVVSGILVCQPPVTDLLQSSFEVGAVLGGAAAGATTRRSELLESAGFRPS